MFQLRLDVLSGDGYRRDPRTSEFSQDLVVLGRVEAYEDIAGLFLIQEVDASQEDPGTDARHDVLYGRGRSFRVDAFIHADPGPCTD